MAAASAAHNDFNASKALEVFARLIIRHYDDVWIEWSFADKFGCLGKDSVGDVFEHVTQQGRMSSGSMDRMCPWSNARIP